MKNLLIVIAYICIASLVGCAQNDSYEQQLKRILAAAPSEATNFREEWILKSGDYTGDGQDDLIAFICTHSPFEEGDAYQYMLYYCSKGKTILCDSICGFFYQIPEIMDIGNTSLLSYTIGYGGPTGESFCWKCTEDSLAPVKPVGELQQIGENYFSSTVSDCDAFLEDGSEYKAGRCWYTYYYYFDGNEFKEFERNEISEKEFVSKTGYNGLISRIKSDGMTVRNIVYRSNGIIDINCSVRVKGQNNGWMSTHDGTQFYYLTLRYKDGHWEIDKEWQEGNIKLSNN